MNAEQIQLKKLVTRLTNIFRMNQTLDCAEVTEVFRQLLADAERSEQGCPVCGVETITHAE